MPGNRNARAFNAAKDYIRDLIEQAQIWKDDLSKIIDPITPHRYNLYFQENINEVQTLINRIYILIECFQEMLEREIDDSWETEFKYAQKKHETYAQEYEKLKSLSSERFSTKQVFLKESDFPDRWYDDNHQILRRDDMVKIKLANEAGTEDLANVLQNCFTTVAGLDYLDLSQNKLEDVFVTLLSNALKHAPGYEGLPVFNCEVLILSYNHISKSGLRTLLKAIQFSRKMGFEIKLKQIILNNNLIDFDIGYFETVVLNNNLDLINLDLTMNFIPKGLMFHEDGIRYYYEDNRLRAKTGNNFKIDLIKNTFSNCENYLFVRSLAAKFVGEARSIVANLDKNNSESEINAEFGVIGLFAYKTTFPPIGEHAFLMVEGVWGFGQRFLIRGDLFTQDGDNVVIRVSQVTPQAFLRFTENGRKLHCRTGTFSFEEIRKIMKEICKLHLQQGFFDYAMQPNQNGSSYNCLTWATSMLKKSTGIDIKGFCPSSTVGSTCFPCNLI